MVARVKITIQFANKEFLKHVPENSVWRNSTAFRKRKRKEAVEISHGDQRKRVIYIERGRGRERERKGGREKKEQREKETERQIRSERVADTGTV